MRITKKQLRNLIQEAMPAGGVPDMVGYLNKGRPDPIVDAMIDDYEDFVEREGHVTRASSSVAASFFMQDPERRDDHDAHQQLADAIGLEHDDIMRDMERQKREQGAMAESRRLNETQITYDDSADTATHASAGGSPQVITRDDYYDMISDFSKELTGRRGTYYRPDQLDAMDIQGVAEYYEDMFDSEEARQVNANFEAEIQKQADEEIGMERDQPALNKAPKSQGMGRRMENVMKITRDDLQRIIKEEKQKLLVEMNPMANAERTLGAYANVSLVDQLSTTVMELLQNIETEAVEDGLDDDEAEDYAADAVVLAVAQAFQAAGLVAEYEALVRTLGR